MREIKFRAWDKAKNEWIAEGFHLMGEVMLGGQLFERSLEQWNDVLIEQFTGLDDKNGVEIYEGDILSNGIDGKRWVIRWHKPGEYAGFIASEIGNDFCSFLLNAKYENAQVIGNIHENKDLI